MVVTRERVVLGAFVANVFLAGGNAVAIRFSNRELAPLWGATLRFGIAAVLLVIVMAGMKVVIPRGRELTGAVLFGLFQFAGAFGLYYYALVRLHAGLGQTLLALVPLATLLLAVIERQERLRQAAIVGIALGLAGVVLISGDPLRGPAPQLLSLLAVLGSVLCFAQSAVIARRFTSVHPVAMNGVGMTVGAAVLFVGSMLAREPHVLPHQQATWVALAYVSVAGSVGVFLLFVFVVHHWTASRASYVMVLIPFVTVVLSAWLDNERVGLRLLLGGVFVLAGAYVGALRHAGRSSTETTAIGERAEDT